TSGSGRPGGRRAAAVRGGVCVVITRTGCGDGSGFDSKSFAPLLWWRLLDVSGVRFRAKDLPRSLVLGNGNTLVGFDATYSVRDIYYPRVGDANHTMGNVCRAGFFIDGKFAWLDDAAWERKLGYAEDSLVSDVTLGHPALGITVKFEDYIDLARNWFIRDVSVTSPTGFAVGRVFFHYDWLIEGSDIGNTVLYEPRHRCVIAYHATRYFLGDGLCDAAFGSSTWANGKKGNAT